MVEEDNQAEGTPLKPSSSSAAIEKSGAKHATKAKALIDVTDEKPEECAQSQAVSALPSNEYTVGLSLDECGRQNLYCRSFVL